MNAFFAPTALLATLVALGSSQAWGQAHTTAEETPSTEGTGTPADPHGAGAIAHDGAAIYARYCALCHGANREGYAADEAPSLRSPQLIASAPGSYLWTAISYGRPNTAMAAFEDTQGGPLSHDAQHALVDWLIETSGLERTPIDDRPVVGNATAGGEVYQQHCAACHGTRGQGGSGTALANPVFLATASDAFIRHTVVHGRDDTPMLAFADRLTEAQINDVVSFVRTRAVGWEASQPILVPPPSPSSAVLNPESPPAELTERQGRFVSAKSVFDAMQRGERMVLLDARPLSDWQRSHLPGALPMPFYDGVDALVPHLPRDDTPIIAYCACPHAASGQVVDALQEAGFSSARILDEGVLVWAGLGYPVALGATPPPPDSSPSPQ